MKVFSGSLVYALILLITTLIVFGQETNKDSLLSDKTFSGIKLHSIGFWGGCKITNIETTRKSGSDILTSYSISSITMDQKKPMNVSVGADENVGYEEGNYRGNTLEKGFFAVSVATGQYYYQELYVSSHKFYFGASFLNSSPSLSDEELKQSVVIASSSWINQPTHSSVGSIGWEIKAGHEIYSFGDFEISAFYIDKISGSFRATDVQHDYHQQDYVFSLTAMSANLLLKTQLINNLYGYFKLGAGGMYRDRTVVSSVRVNLVVNNNYSRIDDHYFSPMSRIGLGLRWFWSEQFPLVFEYEKVNGFGKLKDIRLWNAVIGVCWYF